MVKGLMGAMKPLFKSASGFLVSSGEWKINFVNFSVKNKMQKL